MAYLEVRNAPITQLVQQFYVLVLGLNILGNPYSVIGDFTRGFRQYYEPHLGTASSRKPDDIAYRVGCGAARLLGQCACGAARAPALFHDVPKVPPPRRKDLCRETARAAMARQMGADSAESALQAYVERSGGRLVARRRLPRHCPVAEEVLQPPHRQHNNI